MLMIDSISGLIAYPHLPPFLSTKEIQFIQKIVSMDLNSISENGADRERCKALGQEIYDYTKYHK